MARAATLPPTRGTLTSSSQNAFWRGQEAEQDRPRLIATRLGADVQDQRVVFLVGGDNLLLDDGRDEHLVANAGRFDQNRLVAFGRMTLVDAAQIAVHGLGSASLPVARAWAMLATICAGSARRPRGRISSDA